MTTAVDYLVTIGLDEKLATEIVDGLRRGGAESAIKKLEKLNFQHLETEEKPPFEFPSSIPSLSSFTPSTSAIPFFPSTPSVSAISSFPSTPSVSSIFHPTFATVSSTPATSSAFTTTPVEEKVIPINVTQPGLSPFFDFSWNELNKKYPLRSVALRQMPPGRSILVPSSLVDEFTKDARSLGFTVKPSGIILNPETNKLFR